MKKFLYDSAPVALKVVFVLWAAMVAYVFLYHNANLYLTLMAATGLAPLMVLSLALRIRDPFQETIKV